MKRLYLSIIFVFCMVSFHGQTRITLSFTGKNSANQSAVSLDSVLIRNLTLNCDTVLYGLTAAFSAIAYWPIGLEEIIDQGSATFTLHQNHPNPFAGLTCVEISTQSAGPLNLTLFDETGSMLEEYHNSFKRGSHSFIVASSGYKLLFLTVHDGLNFRTIKMLSAGHDEYSSEIQYLGSEQFVEKYNLKTRENPGFIFYLGNHMKYTAYAEGYLNDSIYDNPTSTIAYTFNLNPLPNPVHTIGESFGGGIIFYLDSTSQHGLISATTDQSEAAEWGCNGTVIGGTSTDIGKGENNTAVVVGACSTSGIATRICDDLVRNGYSDWFLPSKDELNQLYLQKKVVGGFADNYYWSSSEQGIYHSWGQTFWSGSGYANPHVKYASYYVRCVRSF